MSVSGWFLRQKLALLKYSKWRPESRTYSVKISSLAQRKGQRKADKQ